MLVWFELSVSSLKRRYFESDRSVSGFPLQSRGFCSGRAFDFSAVKILKKKKNLVATHDSLFSC